MPRKGYPSDKQDQFVLRLPDGMRGRIKAAAAASGRSMNAELVATLEEAFPPPSKDLTAEDLIEFLDMNRKLAEFRGEFSEGDMAKYSEQLEELKERVRSGSITTLELLQEVVEITPGGTLSMAPAAVLMGD